MILGVFSLISFSNIWALGRLGKYPALKSYPKVSIMIPARNEERNIRRCVDSLLQQDYPDFEVLVLNDHSSDGTEEILKSYKQLKYFNGKPLPEDWLGKHWACHQLVEKASGELYLFTDADTFHRPSALKKAVEAMYAENADFVTVLPKEEVSSTAERLVIPIIGWSMNTFIPFAIAKRSKRPALSATIGQYMLFKKEAYNRIGGYPAIRDRVLDDVTFGRKVKSFGLKWRMYDATKEVSCRMYRNFKEIFEGFTRCIYPIFKNNIFYFLAVLVLLALILFGPWIIVLLHLAGFQLEAISVTLAWAAIFTVYATWLISNTRFRYSPLLTIFYPLIFIMLFYIAYSSMIKTLSGKIVWKGRVIRQF